MKLQELKKRYGKKLPALLKEAADLRQAHSVMLPSVDSISLGKALRQLRKDADIGVNEMAQRIGITGPFLSDCELGRRNLSLPHTVAFLAEVKK